MGLVGLVGSWDDEHLGYLPCQVKHDSEGILSMANSGPET